MQWPKQSLPNTNMQTVKNSSEEKPLTRSLSVEDLGLLFKLALDKSNPKLQDAVVRLLSLIPSKISQQTKQASKYDS